MSALQRVADTHYNGRSAAPERESMDADATDASESEQGDGDGVSWWWVDACTVLSEYATAVARPQGADAVHTPLPPAAELLLRQRAVPFVTSLLLGAPRAVLDIDCIGRFRAWAAPGSPQACALAELAEIKTRISGAHGRAAAHAAAPTRASR